MKPLTLSTLVLLSGIALNAGCNPKTSSPSSQAHSSQAHSSQAHSGHDGTETSFASLDLVNVGLVSASHSGHSNDSHQPSSHGESADHESGHGEHHQHKIVATEVLAKDVVNTRSYVCQIRSCRRIEIKALENGYLEEIPVKEGQMVNKGELMFKVLPYLYEAKLAAETAEAQLAQIEYANAKKLYDQKVVSEQEVALAQAKLSKAQAQMRLSQTELDFASVKAPFDGIIDRLLCQHGSLVSEGDVLTTLSDNSTMWVYFNVPEARYLEYMANASESDSHMEIELYLADHSKFPHLGKIGAIEADFNSDTGNIAFRADFPNREGLLRNGQTGKIHINRNLEGATVIPQRAIFEVLAKRYVYVIGEDHTVHQREVEILTELDDLFVIKSGVEPGEKIVLEGVRQVRDGEKVESEFRDPTVVLQQLKNKAE